MPKTGETHHIKIGPYWYVCRIDQSNPGERKGHDPFNPKYSLPERGEGDFGFDLVFVQRDWTQGEGQSVVSEYASQRYRRSTGVDVSEAGKLRLGPPSELIPQSWAGGSESCLSTAGRSIVNWWPGDSSGSDLISGETMVDSGGAAYDAAAKVGSHCFYCDGTNDSWNVSAAAYPTVMMNNWSIEGWFKPQNTITLQPLVGAAGFTVTQGTDGSQEFAIHPAHGEVVYGSPYRDFGVGLSVGTNGVAVYVHGTGKLYCVGQVSQAFADWTHIGLVWTGRHGVLYINGVLAYWIRPDVSFADRDGTTGQFYPSKNIGGGAYGYYRGYVDELTVYQGPLYQQYMQAVYDAGSDGKCKPVSGGDYYEYTGGWMKLEEDNMRGVGPMPGAGNEHKSAYVTWNFGHDAGDWTYNPITSGHAITSTGINHSGGFISGTLAHGIRDAANVQVSTVNNVCAIASDFLRTYGVANGTTTCQLYNLYAGGGAPPVGLACGTAMRGNVPSRNTMVFHNGKVWILTRSTGLNPTTILWRYEGDQNLYPHKLMPSMFSGTSIATDGSVLYIIGQRQLDLQEDVVIPEFTNPQDLVVGKTEIFYVEGKASGEDPLVSLGTIGEDTDFRVYVGPAKLMPKGLYLTRSAYGKQDLYRIDGIKGGISHVSTLPSDANGLPTGSMCAVRGKLYVSYLQGTYEQWVTPPAVLPPKYMSYTDFAQTVDSGDLDSSYIDYGYRSLSKIFTRLLITMPTLSDDGSSVEVYYSLNGDTSTWYPCTFEDEAYTRIDYSLQESGHCEDYGSTVGIKYFVTDLIGQSAYSLAYRVVLNKGTDSELEVHPITVLAIQPNRPPGRKDSRKVFKYSIPAADNINDLAGGADSVSFQIKMDYLRDLFDHPQVVDFESMSDPDVTRKVVISQYSEIESTPSARDAATPIYEPTCIVEIAEV